jgi:4-diphosphocytidyl-2-C-methyl-D-erythritol kinase
MTATKEKLVLESPAKVNLNLQVLGKRADGFHSIRSILVPITLHDTVTLAPGGRKLVFHGGQGAPREEANLGWRAAQLLSEKTGVRHGIEIRIVKRIPVAAGLGGGSSNAATVLRGLNELWDLKLSRRELETMGLALGSDVPFFLRGGICLAGGRGEELEPLPAKGKLELVLVHPPVKVTSRWAYEHLPVESARHSSSTSMIKVGLASRRMELVAANLVNDLEPGVTAEHAVVGEIKKRLVAAGALGAVMSGSGPTVFGLAQDEASAVSIAEKLTKERGWKVIRASSVV